MLTSKGVSVLFDTLGECESALTYITLQGNQVNDDCMIQLGKFLEYNKCDLRINMVSNDITDKGIEEFSGYLIGNLTLKGLDLRNNQGITKASTRYFIEIAKNSALECINLSDTSISVSKKSELKKILKIPIGKREIPVKSNTKSAAKIS